MSRLSLFSSNISPWISLVFLLLRVFKEKQLLLYVVCGHFTITDSAAGWVLSSFPFLIVLIPPLFFFNLPFVDYTHLFWEWFFLSGCLVGCALRIQVFPEQYELKVPGFFFPSLCSRQAVCEAVLKARSGSRSRYVSLSQYFFLKCFYSTECQKPFLLKVPRK